MDLDIEIERSRIAKTRSEISSLLTIASSQNIDIKIKGKLTPDRLLKELRIASVFDGFSYEFLKNECNLLNLSSLDWRAEIEAHSPDFVMLESAWDGKDNTWHKKISVRSKEGDDLLTYCRSKSIPIVFWNKEDPTHYEKFYWVAQKADLIFTTDIDCVGRYLQDIPGVRAYLLPFAASPTLHNPVEKFTRKNRIVFAGAYYPNFPERKKDMDKMINVSQLTLGLDIYDRNLFLTDSENKFPEEFRNLIVGNLDVSEMDRAYKGYRFGLTINTIKNSQTMFARRTFEQMACNTPTISTYCMGIKNVLGDLTIMSDDDSFLNEKIVELASDTNLYRKFRLRGLRKILTEHTYENRLQYVVEKTLGRKFDRRCVTLGVISHISNKDELDCIVRSIKRQKTRPSRTVIVHSSNMGKSDLISDLPGTYFISQEAAQRKFITDVMKTDYIALLSSEDYYGPYYFTDLLLATAYANAEIIGKSTQYWYDGNSYKFLNDGEQYHFVDSIPMRSCIVEFDRIKEKSLGDIAFLIEEDNFIDPLCFSIDEFNYGRGCQTLPVHLLEEEEIDDGHAIIDLQKKAEEIVKDSSSKFKNYVGSELRNFLSKFGKFDVGNVKWILDKDNLWIQSDLDSSKHSYSKYRAPIPVEELGIDTEINAKLIVETKGNADISLAFVCLDASKQKIVSLFVRTGKPLSTVLPAGTKYVWPWFRATGPGEAFIEKIIIGGRTKKIFSWISNSKCLLLTNIYPSYEELYRNQFVHQRVKAYKHDGLLVDVFRFSQKEESFKEFEGVPIVTGNRDRLRDILESGNYNSILVHFLLPEEWEIIKNFQDRCKIFVWIHGFEIQPWEKRAFNYQTDESLNKAKAESEVKMKFWKGVFTNSNQNVKFIFISKYMLEEAEKDVGCNIPRERSTVLHNFIDTDKFEYSRKSVEQRMKILSIRPFASPVYANDQTVNCILELAKRPFFPELEFRIVGDGSLYSETVEPLKGFENVILEKRFLRQEEIIQLHREYGVFLVPSRMDSQGVSRDEAMSSGLVCISNRVAAIPEFVDGESGILVDPEDFIAMADAIERLYKDPILFSKLSEGASNRVRADRGRENTIEMEIALIGEKTGQILIDEPKGNHEITASIIVPFYGVEQFVRKCLNSLLAQSLPGLEIIVIESSSNDNTAAIVDEFALNYPDRIKVFHTSRAGQGAARNMGIDLARGSYLGFVDGDDWVEPTMFQRLYDDAQALGSDLVVCDYDFVYPDGSAKKTLGLTNNGYGDQRANLLMSGTTASWNKLFKRDLIMNRKFEDDISAEDFRFVTTAIMESKNVSYVNEVLYHYNQRQDSTLKQLKDFSERNFELFTAYRRTLEQAVDIPNNTMDALLDRMTINAFNWRVDDIHKITDPGTREKFALRWARELNDVLPGWHLRKPIVKWIADRPNRERIVECYAKESFGTHFDELLGSEGV